MRRLLSVRTNSAGGLIITLHGAQTAVGRCIADWPLRLATAIYAATEPYCHDRPKLPRPLKRGYSWEKPEES